MSGKRTQNKTVVIDACDGFFMKTHLLLMLSIMIITMNNWLCYGKADDGVLAESVPIIGRCFFGQRKCEETPVCTDPRLAYTQKQPL